MPLRVKFHHLFDLAVDKWVTVQRIESRGWANGGGAWGWRRRLLTWEEETVSECASLLHNVVLQDHIIDRWRWMLDPLHGYSVKGTYAYPMTPGVPSECGRFDDVWLKEVPFKVSVFVGDFSTTESQLKTTFSVGASFLSTTFLALLIAVLPRPWIISYFIVLILEWCGIASFSG